MCGILGIFSKEPLGTQFYNGLKLLQNRGHDGIGIITECEKIYLETLEEAPELKGTKMLAHILHVVVNNVKQPLCGEKGCLVFTGEIYNWKELPSHSKSPPENDTTALFQLLEQDFSGNIDLFTKLDGDYAFVYWMHDQVWLVRDIVGIKPLWYAHTNAIFAIASERKALLALGLDNPHELNPRKVLCYNIKTNEFQFFHRPFFTIVPELESPLSTIITNLATLLEKAVKKRQLNTSQGLLFSGGIDSVILAKLLNMNDQKIPCFVVSLENHSPDLLWSRKAAELLGVELIEILVQPQDIDVVLPQIVNLLEEVTVVKTEIAIPIYFAAREAAKRGIKVLFAGMGADELFGGYYRQKISNSLNTECLSTIRGTYERNTYRDDVITMAHSIELRVPYLDTNVVDYALHIPAEHKIHDNVSKYVLRKVAQYLKLPDEIIWRPKKAIQYGSGADAYLKAKAKAHNCSRMDYLRKMLSIKPLRLGVLFSTGKDSSLALHVMRMRGYEIVCLITIQSINLESYMFHTPGINIAQFQAQSMGLPLVIGQTHGEKEKELIDLKALIDKAKKDYSLDGLISGALYSNYQKTRIEKIAEELGLKAFNPLWHIDQEQEVRYLLSEGFKFVLTAVAAEGLDKSWLGRFITEKDVDQLVVLEKKFGLNVAGEGGEYESLVLDMPAFSQEIALKRTTIVEDKLSAHLEITEVEYVSHKAKLVEEN